MPKWPDKPSISGIYPHLAMFNNEGRCGTGGVVLWADRLWVIACGPHLPEGSSDKLYESDAALTQIVRPESIGGTPANRMIHRESNQLFIGPYVIGADRTARAISYKDMPGHHTANARHLTDSAGKIYYLTMEEGDYEMDVKSLAVKQLFDLSLSALLLAAIVDVPPAVRATGEACHCVRWPVETTITICF